MALIAERPTEDTMVPMMYLSGPRVREMVMGKYLVRQRKANPGHIDAPT